MGDKVMKQFEDKFMEVQASMISLGLEYTKEQVDKVYIYAIADGFYRFDIFFKVGKYYLDRDDVAKYVRNKIDTSDQMQFSLLKYGAQDIQTLVSLCKEYNREHPTEMWLVYDAKTNSLKSKYSYEGRYDKDEELLPRKEFEKWFEEVKKSQE